MDFDVFFRNLSWFLKFTTMMVMLFLVLLLLTGKRGSCEVNHYLKEEEAIDEEKDQNFEDEDGEIGSERVYYDACSFCGKLSTITTSCSRCKTALYCSGLCKVMHWRLWHNYECIEIETAPRQEGPVHVTSMLLIKKPEKESSVSSNEDEQIIDVGEAEYVEETAEQVTHEPKAKLLIASSEEAIENAHETAEQVKSLEEELAKFKNENISLKSERDNWEAQAKDATHRLNSFMKESEHQLLILKHKKELISSAEKQARGMVQSLSERLRSLQITEEKRVAEMRRQEEYILMLQNECGKANREVQELKERVRRLKMEREQATQFAMRLAEETGQKLLTALNAVAAAESRIASPSPSPQVVRTGELGNNSILDKKEACAICLSNEKDMAFGCGHMTCRECGSRISKCPICRQKIKTKVRLFPG